MNSLVKRRFQSMTGDYAMLTCYLMNNWWMLGNYYYCLIIIGNSGLYCQPELRWICTHRQCQTFKLNHHFSNSLVCVSIHSVAVGEKYMNVGTWHHFFQGSVFQNRNWNSHSCSLWTFPQHMLYIQLWIRLFCEINTSKVQLTSTIHL